LIDAGQTSSGSSDGGGGNTWASLYADFFGPTGKAACGGGACHGPGGAYTAYWTCGASAQGCLQGMIAGGTLGPIVPDGGATDPTTTRLHNALCKTGCAPAALMSCEMPFGCTYTFTSGDLQRIDTWITQGAQNN